VQVSVLAPGLVPSARVTVVALSLVSRFPLVSLTDTPTAVEPPAVRLAPVVGWVLNTSWVAAPGLLVRLKPADVAPDAAAEIARRSRGTPRIANRILRRVRDVAEVRHNGTVTPDIAQEALELLEIDGRGLEPMDRELLRAIVERFDGGPVGLSTLAVALGEERDTIEDVYEPYLLQLGFIQRTPRGRIVTPLGREHLGLAVSAENSLF